MSLHDQKTLLRFASRTPHVSTKIRGRLNTADRANKKFLSLESGRVNQYVVGDESPSRRLSHPLARSRREWSDR